MIKLDEALGKYNQLITTYPNSKMVGYAQKIVEAIQKRMGGGTAPGAVPPPMRFWIASTIFCAFPTILLFGYVVMSWLYLPRASSSFIIFTSQRAWLEIT